MMVGIWAIAFGRDGVWAVTDDSYHRVYIFDGQDQLVRKIGSSGKGNGQFLNPQGLAFDANNHLYVSEYSNHRVQKFNISMVSTYCSSVTRDQGMVNFLLLVVLWYTMRDCMLLIMVIAFQCFSLMVNFVALLGQDS